MRAKHIDKLEKGIGEIWEEVLSLHGMNPEANGTKFRQTCRLIEGKLGELLENWKLAIGEMDREHWTVERDEEGEKEDEELREHLNYISGLRKVLSLQAQAEGTQGR